jgi:opacity protein-like surface antigen
MGRFFASVASLLLLCGLSLGQSSNDRFEIFGGYSFVTGDFTGTFADRSTHILNGWNASADYKASPLLGLVADFSGFHAGYTFPGIGGPAVSANSLAALFGPQVSVRLSRATPFAHVLLGVTHVGYSQSSCSGCSPSSANGFSYAFGGGIDYYLTPHIGIRGQADLLHNAFSNADNQLTYKYHELNARISTGLVFRF